MRYIIPDCFRFYIYGPFFNYPYQINDYYEMRCNNGIFLTGVLLITLLSSTVLLLFPKETEEDFLPIIKLAMGITLIRSIFMFFGHSLI